jgi:hypothetical protein
MKHFSSAAITYKFCTKQYYRAYKYINTRILPYYMQMQNIQQDENLM